MTETEERALDEAIQVRLFLRDNRHLSFQETQENFEALGKFLDQHSLPMTAANLHSAYEDLVARGELELTLLAKAEQPARIPQPPIPHSAPVPQAEPEEARLHTVERRPGESSWMAAQHAYAEQQIAAQRKVHQEMRAKMQSLPPRRGQSRDINNQFAALKKPRGKGAALIVDRPDWKME